MSFEAYNMEGKNQALREANQTIEELERELSGVRQINRLQAEALADERALNRQYKEELARLRSAMTIGGDCK